MSFRSQTMASWHTLKLSAVLESLEVSEAGLSQAEATVRLREFAPNRLPEQPPHQGLCRPRQ